MNVKRRLVAAEQGLTILELTVAIAIVVILASMAAGLWQVAQEGGRKAGSTHNIRQLALASSLYLADHDNIFFPYRRTNEDYSVDWWFGHETLESLESPEGSRTITEDGAPLGPYIGAVGGVSACPGFINDKNITKTKYKGASCGYGYNVILGGGWMGMAPLLRTHTITSTERTILFATCAQVNDFEPPASSSHPLLEEFYGLDQSQATIHFRFFGEALVAFVDGHVLSMPMYPGTEDTRIPHSNVGRVTPVNSFEMLR